MISNEAITIIMQYLDIYIQNIPDCSKYFQTKKENNFSKFIIFPKIIIILIFNFFLILFKKQEKLRII